MKRRNFGLLATGLLLSLTVAVEAKDYSDSRQISSEIAQETLSTDSNVERALFREGYLRDNASYFPGNDPDSSGLVTELLQDCVEQYGMPFNEMYIPSLDSADSEDWIVIDMLLCYNYSLTVTDGAPSDIIHFADPSFLSHFYGTISEDTLSSFRYHLYYGGTEEEFLEREDLQGLREVIATYEASGFTDSYGSTPKLVYHFQATGAGSFVNPHNSEDSTYGTEEETTSPDSASPDAEEVDMSNQVALPSTARVMVDGAQVNFGAYEILGFNYFKLTDMAYAIDGTSKQFQVTWDSEKSAINMVTGQPHLHLGTELQGNSGKTEVAEYFNSTVYQDGEAIDVLVYTVNGSSYFQLDSLRGALGLQVGWDGETSTITIGTTT